MTQELYEVIFRGLQAKYPGQPIGPRWRSICATLDEWDESKHPRKDNGQFGTGGGANTLKNREYKQKVSKMFNFWTCA